MEPQSLIHWSSFPSDHAVLFFALAVGIFHVSRRWGWVALAHATVLIAVPRVYLGIHWFTDILAGTALGIVLGLVGMRAPIVRQVQRVLDALFARYPALCYAALFVLTYLIATLFDDARYIGSVLVHYLMKK
jgi:undecaprenyl-diphosphatase